MLTAFLEVYEVVGYIKSLACEAGDMCVPSYASATSDIEDIVGDERYRGGKERHADNRMCEVYWKPGCIYKMEHCIKSSTSPRVITTPIRNRACLACQRSMPLDCPPTAPRLPPDCPLSGLKPITRQPDPCPYQQQYRDCGGQWHAGWHDWPRAKQSGSFKTDSSNVRMSRVFSSLNGELNGECY